MKQVVKNNKKILIFLGYMDDPLAVLPYLKDNYANFPMEDCIIVSMNYFTDKREGLAGLNVSYFEDFLKKEDYEYMENYAVHLSENWHSYFPIEDNITHFKNIEMLKILKLEIYTLSCTAIRNLHVILNIIETAKPSEVILIGENEEDQLGQIPVFLNRALSINARYIKINTGSLHKFYYGLIRKIRRYSSNIISNALNKIGIICLLRNKKYRNSVLTDFRLAHIIKDIKNEFPIVDYIIEKGLDIRLSFLRNKRPYLSFRDTNFLSNNRKEKKYFLKTSPGLKDRFNKDNQLKYKNYFIYDALKNIFKKAIEQRIPYLRTNLSLFYAVFESMKPNIVMLRDSVRIREHSLVSAAKSLNIPTLIIQEGLETLKYIYSEQNAGSMALWGDAYRGCYKVDGNNISEPTVTGHPLHDDIYVKKEGRDKRYEKILRDLGADPGKPTIVYLGNCTEYYPANTVYVAPDLSLFSLKVTLNAFKEFKDVQLVIKLHPYYTRSKYSRFMREISGFSNVFVLKNADISDLFSGSVTVITELFSNAIMNAIILRKPVIFYNFAEKEIMKSLKERGVGFEIKHPEELTPVIKTILFHNKKNGLFSDENFASFTRDYAYKIDGRSSERVKNFIKKLTRK